MKLKQIHTGCQFAEGPCYLKDSNKLIWSDIPGNTMYSFDWHRVEVYRTPSNFANGNTTDNEGNLITCEHGARRVTKTDKNNVTTLVVDEFDDKRLNSPNDVCVHSNGTIFFTDPPYGIIPGKRIGGYPGKMQYGGCYVFKYDPTSKSIEAIVTDMDRPNGIALSRDETHLMISNSGDIKYLRRYEIDNNLTLSNPIEFARQDPTNVFDGFRFDSEDNLWTSCGKSVLCYNTAGEKIDAIEMPERVSNVEFGGVDGKTLFITATTSLYMTNLNFKGAKFT